MWIWQFSTSDSASTGYPRLKCVDWPPPCPTSCRRRSVPSHQMFPRNVETCRHVNGVGTKQGLSQGEIHDTRSTCPVGRVQGFTITGPCWCLVEDSDYLPDLTLKHQTACSRGMLGWMVDNGQPSLSLEQSPSACISDGFRWVRRRCLHPCFTICCATQCLPTSLPQYDCLDSSGNSGRCICSTYGKRIREGPTRNIECHQTHPPTEPAVCHDQSDGRRHLSDSTRHVIASFQLFMVE